MTINEQMNVTIEDAIECLNNALYSNSTSFKIDSVQHLLKEFASFDRYWSETFDEVA
jgi:hypothetical protein